MEEVIAALESTARLQRASAGCEAAAQVAYDRFIVPAGQGRTTHGAFVGVDQADHVVDTSAGTDHDGPTRTYVTGL